MTLETRIEIAIAYLEEKKNLLQAEVRLLDECIRSLRAAKDMKLS